MSDIVIKVENLSKRYRIGARETGYSTFRETIMDAAKAPFIRLQDTWSKVHRTWSKAKDSQPSAVGGQRSSADEFIWALKDISFEVKRGEVVGIIGRNGAGKTTLLKILSKITQPTEGRVELRGRVGSLLEVGTGFHPELTGHQNVYLYGAILGMDRWEITRKFDEIIAFSELERFVDTPVKRYSSGMYMRLAFAVAAYLEPEILLVDEVLAVGDAAFQKKCLGKMGDVSKEGRTVLFVSHNMGAIQSLCNRAFQLEKGYIASSGEVHSVVYAYLHSLIGMGSEMTWPEVSAPGNDEIKLTGIRITDEESSSHGVFSSNKDIFVEVTFTVKAHHSALCIGFDILTSEGNLVFRSYQTDSTPQEWPPVKKGKNRWHCIIPKGLLNGGLYYVAPRIGMHNMYWIVYLDPVVQFEVLLDHGVSPFWHSLDKTSRPGIIAPIFRWYSHDSI
jgi:lipopolysaccharide transport system ATP-binding protein